MNKIIFSFIAILMLSELSFAEENAISIESAPVIADKSAFYLGLGYSYIMSNRTARHNTPGEPTHGVTVRDVDSHTNAILLQAGYQFNKYLALEGRYTFSISDLTLEDNQYGGRNWDDDIDISNIALYLKPIYPIGDFSVYGLLGYGKVERKDNDDSRGDWDDHNFQWGVGAQYAMTDYLLIFVDYTQWHNSDDEAHSNVPRRVDTEFSAASVGITYKF